mmetsp:Transcript_10668/g.44465  ORF Transcript_10668/g.44465 Transcript_10668/m.44465 type:complete len:104 (-) Transcript_10668:628-939(-)
MERYARIQKTPGKEYRRGPKEKEDPQKVETRAGDVSERLATEAREHEANEHKLRMFDLDPRYGPFIGVGRMERWERAQSYGLEPPNYVRELLQTGQYETDGRL